MGSYHDLYLKTDAIILVFVFIGLRDIFETTCDPETFPLFFNSQHFLGRVASIEHRHSIFCEKDKGRGLKGISERCSMKACKHYLSDYD